MVSWIVYCIVEICDKVRRVLRNPFQHPLVSYGGVTFFRVFQINCNDFIAHVRIRQIFTRHFRLRAMVYYTGNCNLLRIVGSGLERRQQKKIGEHSGRVDWVDQKLNGIVLFYKAVNLRLHFGSHISVIYFFVSCK